MSIDYELVNGGYYILKDGERWFFRYVTQVGAYDRSVVEKTAMKDVNQVLKGFDKEPKYNEKEIGSHTENIFTKIDRLESLVDELKENGIASVNLGKFEWRYNEETESLDLVAKPEWEI